MYFFFRFLFGNKIKKIPDRAFENTSSLQIMYVTTESSASFILLMPFYYQHLFLIYSLLCLSLLTLKPRFSFSFSSLQNNNITRIPDYAFKNQRSLEVMYVRKWLPLVVVTIRYAFCTVTWRTIGLGLFYLIGRNALKFFFRNMEAAYGTHTSKH